MHTAAVRRLTGDEHLTPAFTTTWRTYELDDKTRALLEYGEKITEASGLLADDDVQQMRDAGWDHRAIWEATALIALFNFTGRMEAASGLPMDDVPPGSPFREGAR
jgi:uncharacterized peroxidase-related enzyme